MQTNVILSSVIDLVHYDAEHRVLVIDFKDGSTVRYREVGIPLYHQVLQPHPWHRLHDALERLPHDVERSQPARS